MNFSWDSLVDVSKKNFPIVFLAFIIYFAYWTGRVDSQINNHLPTQIQDLKSDVKEIREDIKALDPKIDQNFKEIVRLLSNDRTG